LADVAFAKLYSPLLARQQFSLADVLLIAVRAVLLVLVPVLVQTDLAQSDRLVLVLPIADALEAAAAGCVV
jgi:hypothetical protein